MIVPPATAEPIWRADAFGSCALDARVVVLAALPCVPSHEWTSRWLYCTYVQMANIENEKKYRLKTFARSIKFRYNITHSSILNDCHAGLLRTFQRWHFGMTVATLCIFSLDICINFWRDHWWRKLAAKFVRTICAWHSSADDAGDFRSGCDTWQRNKCE